MRRHEPDGDLYPDNQLMVRPTFQIPRLFAYLGCLLLPLARGAAAQMLPENEVDVVLVREPAVLIQVAGDPVLLPVDADVFVERVVNATRSLYRAAEDGRFWAPVGKYWFTAPAVTGPFERSRGVPRPVATVHAESTRPGSENWKEPPQLYVRTDHAVLVEVAGDLELKRIGEPGGVHRVANTDADLFYLGRDASYYLLAGGRWHRAKDLDESWVQIAAPPDIFGEIPADDPKGYVRAAVPGTREHTAAIAQVTRSLIHKIDTQRMIQVPYSGEPFFVPIAGTDVAYCPNTTYDVFRVGGLYYCCHDAAWYLAADPAGPWSVCAVVPDAVYDIPATHPKARVTHVVVTPAGDEDTVLAAVEGGYDGWIVRGDFIVHRTWVAPFPDGVVHEGRYFGPFADGAYLAPDYGNWGRGDWPQRLAQLEKYMPRTGPNVQAEAPGSDAPATLKARREQIESRGGAREWIGGKDALDERRRAIEDRETRDW